AYRANSKPAAAKCRPSPGPGGAPVPYWPDSHASAARPIDLTARNRGWSATRAAYPASLCGLSHPAPVPPLALLEWQPGIARLSDRGSEDVQATDVLLLVGSAAEFAIQLTGILNGELGYAVDP